MGDLRERLAAAHVHGYGFGARRESTHDNCELVGWQCIRCGHRHDRNPRCCYRCEYTVLAPLWLADALMPNAEEKHHDND